MVKKTITVLKMQELDYFCIKINNTMTQGIIILDFGSQYNQLIARRIREFGVYTEIIPYNTSISEIKKHDPQGIILSGGPSSVFGDEAALVDKELFEMGV